MNLAAIFALLLHSGVCAQSEFHSADGNTLEVMVCPRMTAPDTTGPVAPTEPAPKEAPPAPLLSPSQSHT
jgi:hypothetical protein